MTCNPPFVLQWEIENVNSITPGIVESPVLKAGGFEWSNFEKASIRPCKSLNGWFDFVLNCDKNGWRDWKCKASVKIAILRNSNGNYCREIHMSFDGEINTGDFLRWPWTFLNQPSNLCIIDNKITIEFSINIKSTDIGFEIMPIDLSSFCSPIEQNNVALITGDKKLRVSKDYLAVHSPVFAAMFFGDFAENGKKEVEIKDVVYEEFLDLLQLIFQVNSQIIDSTLLHVLALGDRFQMKQIIAQSELHLIKSSKFSNVKKLLLSDEYRFESSSYTTVAEISALESTPEFAQFSNELKVDILHRMMRLANASN